MIFVSTEKTKTEEVSNLFRTIYDRKPKAYPNGAMMIFIPMNEDTQYSPDYRKKLIFNHESFIGKEDAITINGLQNLNNELSLKNGDKISINMLLKSLPASQGMSRPKLFQFVEPNSSGITTLATFQTQDKPFIEKRKENLEKELRAIIAADAADQLIISDTDGLWCGGITKNNGGKIIPTKSPSPNTQNHIAQISSLLRSPPKKHGLPEYQQNQVTTNKHHYIINSTQDTQRPASVRRTYPPTANHTDPMLTNIDNRFIHIEESIQKQQEHNNTFHTRLLQLESTTTTTDTKIDAILDKLEVMCKSPKCRKVSARSESPIQEYEMDENDHPNSQPHTQFTGCARK
jgi:hypothetical protein